MKKFLVIQTAFIGDVILATAVLEKLHVFYPTAEIWFLVRKGNESLFHEHPFIKQLLVWDKSNKYADMLSLLSSIRQQSFDYVINLQRFASSGIFTAFSKANKTIGFDKNPLSFLFTETYRHHIGNGEHEIQRNQLLIENITDKNALKPRLYPTKNDYEFIEKYTQQAYVCIAPASVWFTKQLPIAKWIDLLNSIAANIQVYILGSKDDNSLAASIQTGSSHQQVTNLCGTLTLLQSAALMQKAAMNYVNDSAPLHLCSAMNAPVTAFYCATVPSFGFTPLSDTFFIAESNEILACRPCGLHGKKTCPEKHFKCGNTIQIEKLSSHYLANTLKTL